MTDYDFAKPLVYVNGKRFRGVTHVSIEDIPRCTVRVRITTERMPGSPVAKMVPSELVSLRVRLGGSVRVWSIPRGFKAEYQRLLMWDGFNAKVVSDTLALVGYEVSAEVIKGTWDLKRYFDAYVWASREYLRASDNPVVVPRKPQFLSKLPRSK